MLKLTVIAHNGPSAASTFAQRRIARCCHCPSVLVLLEVILYDYGCNRFPVMLTNVLLTSYKRRRTEIVPCVVTSADPSNGRRSRQAGQRCPQQDVPAGSCSDVACQGDARTACTVCRAAIEQVVDHRLFSDRLQTRRRSSAAEEERTGRR